MKICISSNTSWYIYNFRKSTVIALVEDGHQVQILAPPDEYTSRLVGLGCDYFSIEVDANGKNPIRDLGTTCLYFKHLLMHRPDVFLTFTPKPNIYGGLASRAASTPYVPNVAGLGSQFGYSVFNTFIIRQLYRIGLGGCFALFVQNEEDRRVLASIGSLSKRQTFRLLGSGVDLERFAFVPRVPKEKFRFIFIGRMLEDKGVRQYVEAASWVIANTSFDVEFYMFGIIPERHPNRVSLNEIIEWEREQTIVYGGSSDNIPAELVNSDCLVLPSFYGEGVPKSLLEAASVGRPSITTDTAGCRDAVEDGVTGVICEPKSTQSLIDAMTVMLKKSENDFAKMCFSARQKAIENFSDQSSIIQYKEIISQLAHG